MSNLKKELEFLNEIDFRNLYLLSLRYKPEIRYESTIQRLVTKIYKNKNINIGKINFTNILTFSNFLDLISTDIYSNYNSKKNGTKYDDIDVEAIYNNVRIRENLDFDYFWVLNSNNQTIRKNGEKLMPLAGKYINDEIEYPLFDIKNKVALKIENSKRKISVSQGVFESEDNFWLFGNKFETDGFSNRIYFNISATLKNASSFFIDIQNWLNKRNIPFKLKFPKSQDDFYQRTDNTVLYVPRNNTLQVFEVIKKIENKYSNSGLFDSESPKFTKIFFDGVSFGESPSDKTFTSFGSYRASVLAIILLDQFVDSNNEININSIDLDLVIDGLNKLSLNPSISFLYNNWTDRFYTNQTTFNNYEFHLDYYQKFYLKKELPIDKDSYLFAAYKIATTIWNEAYIYPNVGSQKLSINWLDCKKNDSNNDSIVEYSSLNGSFEEGLPGVVYFLYQFNEVYPTTFNYTIMYRSILTFVDYKNFEEEKHLFFSLFPGFKSNKKFEQYKNKQVHILKLSLIRNTDYKPFQKLIDRVVFDDYDEMNIDKNMINDLFELVKKDIPLYNFHNNFETNLSLGYGYALLGYFFLRLYDPLTFKAIPSKITYVQPQS